MLQMYCYMVVSLSWQGRNRTGVGQAKSLKQVEVRLEKITLCQIPSNSNRGTKSSIIYLHLRGWEDFAIGSSASSDDHHLIAAANSWQANIKEQSLPQRKHIVALLAIAKLWVYT